MTQIRVENITKVFDSGSGSQSVKAVDDVSLSVESGELFFLLGPSGCGKTTLLRIIAALTEPDAGRIFFDGRDVTHLPCEKRSAAMVFQNYALWPHMTVARNVEFGPKMRGASRGEQRQAAQEALTRVQMADLAERRPNQLSGGQQQRVAVARALAAAGGCLLLDEPLSNLDARLRTHMRAELRELVKATGVTGIYVTHDQKEALSMADRIAVMREGRIVQIASPEELYNHPATRFVADFLGEANFITGRVVSVGQTVEIETPAGVLLAGASENATIDREVTCCVRPERVVMSPPCADNSTALGAAARVESCMYLGETRQYACRLADGSSWKVVSLSTGAVHRPGQEVRLSICPRDIILLEL